MDIEIGRGKRTLHLSNQNLVWLHCLLGSGLDSRADIVNGDCSIKSPLLLGLSPAKRSDQFLLLDRRFPKAPRPESQHPRRRRKAIYLHPRGGRGLESCGWATEIETRDTGSRVRRQRHAFERDEGNLGKSRVHMIGDIVVKELPSVSSGMHDTDGGQFPVIWGEPDLGHPGHTIHVHGDAIFSYIHGHIRS